MVSGESQCYLGRRYRLRVVYGDGPGRVIVRTRSILELHVVEGTPVEERARVLRRWYREAPKALVPPLIDKWQTILGVTASGGWGIKRMKTKRGTCPPRPACGTEGQLAAVTQNLAAPPQGETF